MHCRCVNCIVYEVYLNKAVERKEGRKEGKRKGVREREGEEERKKGKQAQNSDTERAWSLQRSQLVHREDSRSES